MGAIPGWGETKRIVLAFNVEKMYAYTYGTLLLLYGWLVLNSLTKKLLLHRVRELISLVVIFVIGHVKKQWYDTGGEWAIASHGRGTRPFQVLYIRNR